MERVSVEHDVLQNRSACVKVRHNVLIENSKDDSCSEMLVNQEERHFEVEEIMIEINEEYELCVKEDCFDECRLESTSDYEKNLLRSIFDGLMH